MVLSNSLASLLPFPVMNIQTALIVRRTCVWLQLKCALTSGTSPFPSEGSRSCVNSQVSAGGPAQAEGWAVWPGAAVLVSHSLRGTHATDTFLQHRSCYKRQVCPRLSQLGFLGVCTEGLKWKEKLVCQSTCCGADFRAWRLPKVRVEGTPRIPALSWCCVCQSVAGWACSDEFTGQGRALGTPAFLWKRIKRARSSLKRLLCGHKSNGLTWLLRSNKIREILTPT